MINIYRSQGDVISMTRPSSSLADLLEKSTETTDFIGEQRVKIILADAKVRLFQAEYHAAVVAKKRHRHERKLWDHTQHVASLEVTAEVGKTTSKEMSFGA